jgi:predicted lipoprotein with Yx(FWY)xxD motif
MAIRHYLMVAGAMAVFSLAGVALAAAPITVRDSGIGQVLANPDGNTLYTFDKDGPDSSSCTGTCAERWLPAIAAESDQTEGDYTVIAREDGTKQWAYKGKPLYTLRDDATPGDTKGEGMGGVWHAARP